MNATDLIHFIFTFLLCHSATVFSHFTHSCHKPGYPVSWPIEDEKQLVRRRSEASRNQHDGWWQRRRWKRNQAQGFKTYSNQEPLYVCQAVLHSVVISMTLEITFLTLSLSCWVCFVIDTSCLRRGGCVIYFRRLLDGGGNVIKRKEDRLEQKKMSWLPALFYFLWNPTSLSLIFFVYKIEEIIKEIILIKYLPE